ncbi:MAG TPA: sulfotransferase [Mycobacteriales bacterium]|nr:sulfotransferase [Mycobacteriales bacterium]
MRRGLDRDLAALEHNLVWIVGSPRSGTTWLLALLAAHPRVRTIDEPLIGAHLGFPAHAMVSTTAAPADGSATRTLDVFRGRGDYFFSDRFRDSWQQPLRELILRRLLDQLREDGGDPRRDVLVVKEPHGSEAADLLIAALPQSRLVVAARDGRDVVDSVLDAVSPHGWARGVATLEPTAAARRAFVADYAHMWAERMGIVLRTCERLPARQHRLVRYEDLRRDTGPAVVALLEWLGLPVLDDLDAHVERLAFERVPAEQRGPGRFHRAASPGGWRQRLTAEEQAVATAAMAPVLRALGYDLD